MIGKAIELIKWLYDQDRDKLFEVKPHREKRSLNANAYAWSLMGRIADEVGASKDEIYMIMLRRYGQQAVVSVMSQIDVDGYFKYFEQIGESSLHGRKFAHYKVYKGSSEMDTKEMSVLIDGIISEAKELGIETLPPAEVERLKASWRAVDAEVSHK